MPAWGYPVILFFVAALAIAFSFKVGRPATGLKILLLALVIWQGKFLFLTICKGGAWVQSIARSLAASLKNPPLATTPDEPTRDAEAEATVKRRPQAIPGAAVMLLLGAAAFRVFCGIFVIQPIGAIPAGATVIYFRQGLNLPFISSADGLQQETTGEVNLIGRAIMLGGIGNALKDRKLISLPYIHTLYLWSTGGREYNR